MKKETKWIVSGSIVVLAMICMIAIWNIKSKKETIEATTASATTEKASESTQAATEEVTTEETKEEKTTKEEATEATVEDKEPDPEVQRSTEKEDELFRIALLYADQYELDTEEIKIQDAMIAQDDMNDKMYLICGYKMKKQYICYSYDGNYFLEDSQKEIRKQYEQEIKNKKFSEESSVADDSNMYYQYSEKEIENVNNMF